ncbi:MAG: glycosyltransferase [Candidatus Eremiobacteraeota bacterium]|nr:glycosyltransferase [Candidatus Eremiobacteraeota bacterium]MBV8366009.1 glycosyltransferase [Candidatus Eremiobacteraeota bacterium]
MRVAFVHDYLTQLGGAERVLAQMHELYPDAPIFTSLYDRRAMGAAFAACDIRTTWLQRIPGAPRRFRTLLPLYPAAFEALDLRGYDLVISSTTSFAKGVRVPQGTLHVCYMNTPTRFLWYPQEYAFEIVPALARPALRAALPRLRRWDYSAAQRPQHIVANSDNVAARIRACYHRDSDVAHCPVDVDSFAPAARIEDYYLVIARLLPYKRVALAIEACNTVRAPLVVAGVGPDEARLRALAGPTIRFEGWVDDDRRRALLAQARAVVVPGVEDYGLVALEAAASGRPTVAFAAGGSLETIVEGETGSFFREPTPEALAAALRSFVPEAFSVRALTEHAARFSPDRFRARMRELIERYVHDFGAAETAWPATTSGV